jgi:hypothetical protein
VNTAVSNSHPRYPDLEVQNEGSIFLLRPLTDTGAAWIGENLASEDVQYFGDALCVEHRFIGDIVEGAISDGLVVK